MIPTGPAQPSGDGTGSGGGEAETQLEQATAGSVPPVLDPVSPPVASPARVTTPATDVGDVEVFTTPPAAPVPPRARAVRQCRLRNPVNYKE